MWTSPSTIAPSGSLPDDATLRDVAHHRDFNHGYANDLAGLPQPSPLPAPRPAAPTWRGAA